MTVQFSHHALLRARERGTTPETRPREPRAEHAQTRGAGDWEKPLLSGFVEAVKYTDSVRSAERWEPE